jgi:Ca-activated chloride channel family protein
MIRVFSAVFVVLVSVLAASAQNPVGTPPPLVVEDNEVLRIDSRLVVVPVAVVDSNGQPVPGLTLEDFIIKEGSRVQQITEVSAAEKVPLEIAVLFDISGSTDPMFKFEQETAAKFLQEVMRPIDRATIFTIGEEPNLVQNRNVAFESIATIKSLQPTKGHTAFFDTVSAAATYLRQNAPPKSRKVIITISDGEDNTSDGIRKGNLKIYADLDKQKNTLTTAKLRDFLSERRNSVRLAEQRRTLQKIQDADTVFYSINPAGSSYRLNKISVAGQDNMEKFANDTGGMAFLPKFLPIDLKSDYESNANLAANTNTLEVIFRQLANELQAQYLVQYYSDGDFKLNDYVNLDVTLGGGKQYRVRARQGYFVKEQQ